MNIQQQIESGWLHFQAGRYAEAEAIYRQILSLQPDHPGALHLLGVLAIQVGQFDAAVDLLRRTITLIPNSAEANYHLGTALQKLGQCDSAIVAYRQTIHINPDLVEAHCNLGGAFQDTGQIDHCIDSYRRVLRIKPDFAEVHSNLLLALNYQANLDPAEIFREHVAWSDRHGRPASEIARHANNRLSGRRLRIGYVSADFWRHSVAHFFIPLLENHDRRLFEVFCYSGVARPDDVTERIKRSSDVWHEITAVTDESLAEMVRSDEIDILVDLSGHTAGNRLRTFARKPSPVQISYLGYPNTTGIAAIDYRLTDKLADPPGMTEHLFLEKLWRLPSCAWCFEPPTDAPDVQPRADGTFTFGSFNALQKINPGLIDLWAQLLTDLPESRLILKSAGAGEPSVRERIIGQFLHCGIAGDRIELMARIPGQREHLELYRRIDVALDTFPYHGTTTTCEAFWMGVPVVTLGGQTHASRAGVSLLTAAGLPELIAQSPQEYVSIASTLATDPSRLETFRKNLRNQVKSSPLVNGKRFAAEIENAYRQMWQIWCNANS